MFKCDIEVRNLGDGTFFVAPDVQFPLPKIEGDMMPFSTMKLLKMTGEELSKVNKDKDVN